MAAGDEHYEGFEDICRNKLTKKKEEKLKHTSGDGEGASCSVVTKRSKSRKEVIDPTLDGTGGIQPPTSSGPNLEKQLPPDEGRCCLTGGGYRCKNFRMGYGAAVDDDTVPKTKFCEKHYNLYAEYYKKKKKKRSGHGEGTGSGPDLVKQLPPDEERCSKTSGIGKYKYRCKNFRMGLGASDNDNRVPKTNHCEKHYNYFGEYAKKRMWKKKTSGDGEDDDTSDIQGGTKKKEIELPPDEQRCCQTAGRGWRCKNFRMSHSAASDDDSVPKTNYCEKHYNYFAEYKKKKKTSGEGEGDLQKQLPPDEERCCHTGGGGKCIYRCKNFRMGYGADDDAVPKTNHCEKHYNYFSEYKKKKKQRSGDGEGEGAGSGPDLETERRNGDTVVAGGSAKIGAKRKNVIETRTSKRRKNVKEGDSVVAETSNQPADTIVEGGSANHGRKRKYAEKLSGELESLAGTRKTTSTNDNEQTLAHATGRWKKLLPCLQSKKIETSARGKESSILRCVELGNSERVESEVLGLQNDITQSCGKPTDESNKSTFNAEADKHHESESELPKYPAMNISSATLHLSMEGQNVEKGKGLGSSSDKLPQHGSSSQDHVEMSTERFANLVLDDGGGSLSESEDFDSSLVSKNSLCDPMDMLAMKNWNRNKEEMKWKSEADMLSSFEKDADICVKAICALYRQEISEDKISPKGLYFHDDTLRCTTLAKFLMDNDCNGDLEKSVAELEKFDSKAVGDCKKLVRRYSIYLFNIYINRKDPFFLPVTTAGHGDQTSK